MPEDCIKKECNKSSAGENAVDGFAFETCGSGFSWPDYASKRQRAPICAYFGGLCNTLSGGRPSQEYRYRNSGRGTLDLYSRVGISEEVLSDLENLGAQDGMLVPKHWAQLSYLWST